MANAFTVRLLSTVLSAFSGTEEAVSTFASFGLSILAVFVRLRLISFSRSDGLSAENQMANLFECANYE